MQRYDIPKGPLTAEHAETRQVMADDAEKGHTDTTDDTDYFNIEKHERHELSLDEHKSH